ncbi:hypothetical protein B0T18DRAFT_448472 [Schizothecium vesticola]|uniref:F-box domain-containing protein n=1 Tax=Schizothecium vesticola TaxID=314040 RepID=A0AA40EQY4_9PEZI|nr:hypothetical protein B0T18DRAFT_448472 [Schizothecium vesticola]
MSGFLVASPKIFQLRLVPIGIFGHDSFEDVAVQASQQIRKTHLSTTMASNAPATSPADDLLSIAYRELETANKKLEEATIALYRLKLIKLQCCPYPSEDYDELDRERKECLYVLFGTPPRWGDIFNSEWWTQAMEAGLGDSVDELDDLINRAQADKVELEAPQAFIRCRIADMTHDQVRNLGVLDLPDEILVTIFQCVEDSDLPSSVDHDWGDGKDIVSARQVCRRFCYAASGFLVRRICVEPSKASLARLEEVSRHPAIAAGVYHVKLVLRFYNPSLASMNDFATYHAETLDAQIKTWQASQPDQENVAGQAAADVKNADSLILTLLLLAQIPAGQLDVLPDDNKSVMERLGQAHREYLRLFEEQKWLLSEGRFAKAAGSAMARMPRARHLEIADTDPPEVVLFGPGVDLWGAMEQLMRQPMGRQGAIACNRIGIQPPSYKCVVDMLDGVRGAGAWLETMAIDLHSPGLVGSMAPTLDTHRELASGLQKLKRFEWKIRAEMAPESMHDVEKFLRACIDTPSLEYIGIDIKGQNEAEPSVDMGKVMGVVDRKLLRSLWLCRVDFQLDHLKVFLSHLNHERVSLSMADLFLLSGTWKELLDVLRNKEAGEKWLRRPAGQEIEDMSMEEYHSIFAGEGGGGKAQLYISKKLSGWSAPNPIHALEERRAAAAAAAAPPTAKRATHSRLDNVDINMLVSSVRAAHRPRGIRSGSLDAAARLRSAALLSHQLQHTRGFRFGWYRASYGSPEPPPDDMYLRCRKFRYKYTSSTVRDTTPGRTVLIDDADSTARRFGLWRIYGRAREHSHKAQGPRGATITPGNPEGVRPGQGIEDVERAPMESLIFGTAHQSRGNMRGTPIPDSEVPFTIDPITNRKVYGPQPSRMGASSASNVAGFSKSNKPDFESLRPPHIDDTRTGNPFDAPPILESEQYLADLAGFPTARDILGLKEKNVSWHPAEGLAAPTASPQTNRDEHPLDHQILSHASRTYDDLHEYGPVDFAEPDGKIAPEAWDRSHTRQYEDIDKYEVVRSHEPDGEYKHTSESTVDSSELKEYKPVRSHEPDGKYKETPEPSADASELENYQPFRSHEPDGKQKQESEFSVDPSELAKYQPFRSHEPDGKQKQESEFSVDPSELAKYQPFRSHEPDGMYAAAAHNSAQLGVKKDCPDLEWYNHGLFSHEPDGKYAAEATKPTPAQVLEGESFEYDLKGIEASGATPEEKTYYRQMLESFMARLAEEEPNAADSSPQAPLNDHAKGPVEKKVLTGNYVRDFPEEFARSWTTKDSTLLPTDIDQSVKTTTPPPPSPTQPTTNLQPALDRYPKSPNHTTPPTPPNPTPQPTLYKLLTHDPLTNLITTTTTTSSIPSNTPLLTPADILPLLSHPARFITHFPALQAQGFELVSGAGDVLVFRKVREPSESESKSESVSESVNPIDMMGKQVQRREYYATAAERFASPTGFVNYELPQPQKQVRRVEEVFSGPKIEAEEVPEEQGKKGVGKRLVVGAAWMAGVAYSIGVVGEFLGNGGL